MIRPYIQFLLVKFYATPAGMCQLSLRGALNLLPFQELSEQRSLILRAQVADSTAILAQEAVERTRIHCRRGGVGMFSQPLVSGFKPAFA